jgi:hypothetical protein
MQACGRGMNTKPTTPLAQAIERAHVMHGIARYKSSAFAITNSYGKVTHADQALLNEIAQHAQLPMQKMLFEENIREHVLKYWEDYNTSTLEVRRGLCAAFVPDPFSGRAILIFRMND